MPYGIFYAGRAMFKGPDEKPFGVVHGKAYEIEAKKMKSGKIRITVADCDIGPFRISYDDMFEYNAAWRQMGKPKHAAR